MTLLKIRGNPFQGDNDVVFKKYISIYKASLFHKIIFLIVFQLNTDRILNPTKTPSLKLSVLRSFSMISRIFYEGNKNSKEWVILLLRLLLPLVPGSRLRPSLLVPKSWRPNVQRNRQCSCVSLPVTRTRRDLTH